MAASRRRSTRLRCARPFAFCATPASPLSPSVFLYSFLDPAHEQAARRIITEEFPEAFVCSSHEVAPEFREYERLSTTVVNACLGPVMAFYIRGVADRLASLGVTARPYLTQSNGGVIGFETAARLPVRMVLSGPSTGVVGAQMTACHAGAQDIITFDMGGTSTDVALLQIRKIGDIKRYESQRLMIFLSRFCPADGDRSRSVSA